VNPALERPSDLWVARSISALLHLGLLLLLGKGLISPPERTQVIFSVETVSGVTPLGEGSGAEGSAAQMSNTPANANPLAGGLRLNVSDAPVPAPAEHPAAKPAPAKPHAAPPSLSDLAKRYENLGIGQRPRDSQAGDEPSEGGMGNARTAGTENGAVGVSGPLAGRRFRAPDYSFDKPLPEESEVALLITVGPKGEVLEAQIKKTSGYPELDQHALSKAREIVFDPVPPGGLQEPVTGTIVFRFEYSGRARF
jgi:TonB family protein